MFSNYTSKSSLVTREILKRNAHRIVDKYHSRQFLPLDMATILLQIVTALSKNEVLVRMGNSITEPIDKGRLSENAWLPMKA
jgi:hypothetical protein